VTNPEPSSFLRPRQTWRWELPPLILHPFSDKRGPETLVECSRAQLMLAGILPMEGFEREALEKRVIDGRICEVRMLYYVGLDLDRWLEQCTEVAAHEDKLKETGLSKSSFASLLVTEPPAHVHAKLQGWGVADYKSLFSRALGLNAVFSCPPDTGVAQSGFLLDYHRYADIFFRCWKANQPGDPATPDAFTFELYASGEYSRILEHQWDRGPGGDPERENDAC
jgi:hypothetical protein